MESLEEKREQAAKEYGKHIENNWHSLGTYKVADFRAGWDACQKEMEAKLAVATEALEFYAKGEHLWTESEDRPGNVCDPIGHTARQALAKLARPMW